MLIYILVFKGSNTGILNIVLYSLITWRLRFKLYLEIYCCILLITCTQSVFLEISMVNLLLMYGWPMRRFLRLTRLFLVHRLNLNRLYVLLVVQFSSLLLNIICFLLLFELLTVFTRRILIFEGWVGLFHLLRGWLILFMLNSIFLAYFFLLLINNLRFWSWARYFMYGLSLRGIQNFNIWFGWRYWWAIARWCVYR
jgi:hypothetical protein